MTVHKGNSVVVFRAAPGASREGVNGAVEGGGRGGVGGGARILSLLLEVRHCPPRHHMSFLCFPDVTPMTTGQFKSRSCGPNKGEESLPLVCASWTGWTGGWGRGFGGEGRKGLSSSPVLLVTQGNTGCCCRTLRWWW